MRYKHSFGTIRIFAIQIRVTESCYELFCFGTIRIFAIQILSKSIFAPDNRFGTIRIFAIQIQIYLANYDVETFWYHKNFCYINNNYLNII